METIRGIVCRVERHGGRVLGLDIVSLLGTGGCPTVMADAEGGAFLFPTVARVHPFDFLEGMIVSDSLL
jgi:hypothetical protein